jgi:hypothetical protein
MEDVGVPRRIYKCALSLVIVVVWRLVGYVLSVRATTCIVLIAAYEAF